MRNPTVVSMIFLLWIWRKSNHNCNSFLSEKSKHWRKSLHSCNPFFTWEIQPLLQWFLTWMWRKSHHNCNSFLFEKSNRCFNYFTNWNLSKTDHSCNPFLYEKSNRCFNDFLLEFEANLTIIAIPSYLRNPIAFLMMF